MRVYTRDEATRMLYLHSRTELRLKHRAVLLYTLFVSDRATYLLRPHLFKVRTKPPRAPGRTAEEWADWFRDNYGDILRNNILEGMSARTGGKSWRVYTVIGFHAIKVGGRRERAKPRNSKVHTRRHKTKRARQ
jgi:hypothetical protein